MFPHLVVRFLVIVVKTCRGGYDYSGQTKVSVSEDIEEAIIFIEKISLIY